MTSCIFEPRLTAYHDHELPEFLARQIESHLDRCAACREELAALSDVSLFLTSTEDPTDVTADELSRMHQAVAAEPEPRSYALLQPMLAIAASVLVICGVWIAALPAPTSSPVAASDSSNQSLPDWQRLAMTLHADPRANPDGEVAQAQQDDTRLTDWIIENLTSSN